MGIFRIVSSVFLLAGGLSTNVALALPPQGVTRITDQISIGVAPTIGVVNEVAYITHSDGIYPVDENGVGDVIVLKSPFGGTVDRVNYTRVTESIHGNAHVAVGFIQGVATGLGAATFDPFDPSEPIDTWPGRRGALGLTPEGAIFGGGKVFHPGGSMTTYLDPPAEEVDFFATDATPSGRIIGYSTIPGTFGARVVMIDLDGGYFSFGDGSGPAEATIRDRLDGGVNVGLYGAVRYLPSNTGGGNPPEGFPFDQMLVSESDFAVMGPNTSLSSASAFYPGVDPEISFRGVPLLDLFPELADFESIRKTKIADIASSEGQIHLLLSGENGLWLYAAPDPSVIPEPTAATLALLAAAGLLSRRRR